MQQNVSLEFDVTPHEKDTLDRLSYILGKSKIGILRDAMDEDRLAISYFALSRHNLKTKTFFNGFQLRLINSKYICRVDQETSIATITRHSEEDATEITIHKFIVS